LIKENQKFFIKKKAYDYLGKRIHSAYELRIKLLRKKSDSGLINEAIDDLRNGNYLDDTKFAEVFIEEKIRLKSLGKTKLKSELIKRGISADIISSVLLEKTPNEADEFELAYRLAEKKYNSLKNRNLEKAKLVQKIYSFLLSKGYNFDVSMKVVDKILDFTIEENQ
jgi:regulatory protein